MPKHFSPLDSLFFGMELPNHANDGAIYHPGQYLSAVVIYILLEPIGKH